MPANLKPLHVPAWGIGISAILAALLGAATFWLSARIQADDQLVSHTLAVQKQIADVSTFVQRAEASQRGYLLTKREAYLGPYKDTETALLAAIDELDRLVAHNPLQQERVARLRGMVADKLHELRATIDEQNAGRADAALAVVNSDRGLQLMDQIRQLLSEMEIEEERLLTIRASTSETVGALLQVGAAIGFVLILLSGVLVTAYATRTTR